MQEGQRGRGRAGRTRVVYILLLRRTDRPNIEHLRVVSLAERLQEPFGTRHLVRKRLHALPLRRPCRVAGEDEDLETRVRG